MLTKRIIPCLDVDRGRVVKGTRFRDLRDAGNPADVAEKYNEEGADEIVFLDITASHEDRNILLKTVQKTAEKIFIPLTVGGGVRTLEDIKNILHAGADKVAINTAAVKDPLFVKKAAEMFGAQCIVVAIDAKESKPQRQTKNPNRKRKWLVHTHGGRKATKLDVLAWAKKMEKYGAGEILLTSMDCDGTKNGYDLDLTRAVSKSVKIPVIASGGVGNPQHILEALEAGAAAALAASIFHFREFSIHEVKEHLWKYDIPIRL